jgi:hypothetical protein
MGTAQEFSTIPKAFGLEAATQNLPVKQVQNGGTNILANVTLAVFTTPDRCK